MTQDKKTEHLDARDTRPKDSIRDAFEAMLAFFALLFTRRHHQDDPSYARDLGEDAAVDMLNRPEVPAPKAIELRDLIQRAAEEHAKIEGCDVCAEHGPDVWTPERIAEALERCERATPGPWAHDDGRIYGPPDEHGECDRLRGGDLDLAAAARTDLPSALRALAAARGEIERLTVRLRHAEATAEQDAHDSNLNEREAKAEIERLNARHAADRAEMKEALAEMKRCEGALDAAIEVHARKDAEIERLRALLIEAEPRIKPEPPARHPEDWEPDDLRARVQTAIAPRST